MFVRAQLSCTLAMLVVLAVSFAGRTAIAAPSSWASCFCFGTERDQADRGLSIDQRLKEILDRIELRFSEVQDSPQHSDLDGSSGKVSDYEALRRSYQSSSSFEYSIDGKSNDELTLDLWESVYQLFSGEYSAESHHKIVLISPLFEGSGRVMPIQAISVMSLLSQEYLYGSIYKKIKEPDTTMEKIRKAKNDLSYLITISESEEYVVGVHSVLVQQCVLCLGDMWKSDCYRTDVDRIEVFMRDFAQYKKLQLYLDPKSPCSGMLKNLEEAFEHFKQLKAARHVQQNLISNDHVITDDCPISNGPVNKDDCPISNGPVDEDDCPICMEDGLTKLVSFCNTCSDYKLICTDCMEALRCRKHSMGMIFCPQCDRFPVPDQWPELIMSKTE